MTAAEFKAYFLAEYDAATSLSAPAWEDSEISSFLNIAQDSVVTELYKVKELNKLAELINTTYLTFLQAHPSIFNGLWFDLTNVSLKTDYFYFIGGKAAISRTNPIIYSEWIPIEFVDRVNADKFFQTSFNKPWFRNPKIFIDTFDSLDQNTGVNTRFVVLVDGYSTRSIANLEVTFLKKPDRINITLGTTTNLNESLHQAIVAFAVEQAVKSVKTAKISNQ
jgi:hypothetical protein